MNELRKKWWVFSIQGLFLLTLGFLVLFSVGPDLPQLIELLGVSLLVFGFIILIMIWIRRNHHPSIWNYILGGIQVLIGVLVLVYRDHTVNIFGYSIGFWAASISIWQIYLSLRNKAKRWLYFINAAVSALCTILIFINPFEDERSAQIIGFYSILLGGFIIYSSIGLRKAIISNSNITNESLDVSKEEELTQDSSIEE